MEGFLINVMKQPNYNKKLLKRKYQEKFFSQVKNKNCFIGLCGTNPEGYLRIIKKCRFKKTILFDIEQKNLQKLTPITADLWLYNEDINNNLDQTGSFYDLDYCCCINTIQKYLSKIMKIKEFTLTLALRPISEEKTLKILNSYGRNFMYRVYREGGTPMMILYFSKN